MVTAVSLSIPILLASNGVLIILVYVAGRFVLGFGNSLAQMASPVLLTEICHPQHRGKVTAIYNCLWNLGALCKFRACNSTGITLIGSSRRLDCVGNHEHPQ